MAKKKKLILQDFMDISIPCDCHLRRGYFCFPVEDLLVPGIAYPDNGRCPFSSFHCRRY